MAISNPKNLGDPVFGLLGAAAAAGGLGTTTVCVSDLRVFYIPLNASLFVGRQLSSAGDRRPGVYQR